MNADNAPINGDHVADDSSNSLYKRNKVANARVLGFRPVIPPSLLQEELPLTAEISSLVLNTRFAAANILNFTDDRLLCIVGPCSIHDYTAAIDYATRLKALATKFSNTLLIIMRVYFEKPRTTVGWKGLINDPQLNGSFEINKGLRLARKILLEINELGLPCGCEFLDAISPQFTSDLVSWGAIGARTTESQIHRELASGLSCPIVFKNGTAGTIESVQIALDAIISASGKHHFLGVNDQGIAAIVSTLGNESCHVILRGGTVGVNYESQSVADVVKLMGKTKNLVQNGIMIDCSHGNSLKNHNNQSKVVASVSAQLSQNANTNSNNIDTGKHIIGVMIESNIRAGKQNLEVGETKVEELEYGKSVTDACVDLSVTEEMLNSLSQSVLDRRRRLAK